MRINRFVKLSLHTGAACFCCYYSFYCNYRPGVQFMKIFQRTSTCFLLSLLFFACRKPYNPPAITAPNNYLVVEGVINSGNDSTIIKLSRTVNLNAQVVTNPVTNAVINVESDQNGSWPLTSDGAGNYYTVALNLPSGPNYRIHITTSDGRQYVSDYQPIKPTPPIDSIGYTINANGVNLYVNTHDPANNTHYYQWEYNEGWIFHAQYESFFIADPSTNSILPRQSGQDVYYCYGNDVSSNLLLSSTARLSHDVVYQAPLTTIPFNSEKLEITYEIYLKQYALTGDAYSFFINMQKNTEQLGSIFDAQPSELQGNIHNINNAAEPVIGWISVTNIQTKTIAIPDQVVPAGTVINYPANCAVDSALFVNKQGYNDVQNILLTPPITELPILQITDGPVVLGYTYSSRVCTDCTLRGSKTPPWFWK